MQKRSEEKVQRAIVLHRKPIAELRSVTCHIGSHRNREDQYEAYFVQGAVLLTQISVPDDRVINL